MSSDDQAIYYLPGRGGRVDEGLGLALQSRGFVVYGRQLFGEFQRLRFSDQIQAIAEDLKQGFWREDALVVANSFGAYLYLHAQTLQDPFPGKVLLLSPIIGATAAPGNGPRFSPPFAERLLELAQKGELTKPTNCEIHVGELDWQSEPAKVECFGELTGIPVTVVPGGAHMLDKKYVSGLLDRWLPDLVR
ncbi:hypothetical protein [Porphyrobacter sp. LM 6]|uniref:hypothetical protein n=1 Tax=Porphyrobacter sp. LM 6 TaxID=1896196 RepID=UPI00084679C5|nr:hypothetical protein [Porphyrobacter sp. LM 6]AOL94023.1 hypothetical protein BG023_111086 [Porphyrobacter sp. LM 6]